MAAWQTCDIHERTRGARAYFLMQICMQICSWRYGVSGVMVCELCCFRAAQNGDYPADQHNSWKAFCSFQMFWLVWAFRHSEEQRLGGRAHVLRQRRPDCGRPVSYVNVMFGECKRTKRIRWAAKRIWFLFEGLNLSWCTSGILSFDYNQGPWLVWAQTRPGLTLPFKAKTMFLLTCLFSLS